MPVGSWDSAAPPQGVVVPLPVQLARPKSRARTRPSLAMTPPEVQGQPSLCPSDGSTPHHDRVGEGLARPGSEPPEGRRLMGVFDTTWVSRTHQGPPIRRPPASKTSVPSISWRCDTTPATQRRPADRAVPAEPRMPPVHQLEQPATLHRLSGCRIRDKGDISISWSKEVA